MKVHLRALLLSIFLSVSLSSIAQKNVIDQVIWFVGDEPILKSDVEAIRLQMQMDGERIDGNPYCFIPEQIAINKLYLNQAKIDSIEVPAASVNREVERLINYRISQVGSREKLEEYAGKSLPDLRDEWREQMRERQIIQQMQQKIVGTVKLTPSDVRKYYARIPQDSLPYIPTTVEVQIMTLEPEVPLKEQDAVKARLREITNRVYNGENFSTLAVIYSEDTESAKRGGELGFMGRAQLVPEFANVAFALSDPQKVSNIVETEYGYHIIQLIEKQGERANFRHILMKPRVSSEVMDSTMHKMDSIMNRINQNNLKYDDMYKIKAFIPENQRGKALDFDNAITFLSHDVDTRNNKGVMVNQNQQSNHYGTPRFEMQELPTQIALQVEKMQVGDISSPFKMTNSKGKEVVAVVKLRNRIEGHKANIQNDYVVLKNIVEAHKKEELLDKWVRNKINTTDVRIIHNEANCDFRYPGWNKK